MAAHNQCHGIFRNLLPGMGLVVLSALLFVGCQEHPEKAAGPPEKITIAYPTTVLSILFHLTFEKGYFLAEGLEVIPQSHEFGKVALQSLLEGKADLAIVADTPVMFAVAGGKKIYVIAVVTTSSRGNALISRKTRGVSTPMDIKGKTIGVALGTTGDFFLDSFLSTRGINRGEVTIIDMRPGEMPDALMTGKVDAVSVWQPTLMQLQRELGKDGVTFYDEDIYSDITCLAVRQEFVEKHPEAITRVLKAFVRAEMFVEQNQAESLRLAAEFMGMEQSFLAQAWGSLNFGVRLDQSLLLSLEDQTRWAQNNKLMNVAEMPNYLDFIYVDGLRSVKPEAIKMIR